MIATSGVEFSIARVGTLVRRHGGFPHDRIVVVLASFPFGDAPTVPNILLIDDNGDVREVAALLLVDCKQLKEKFADEIVVKKPFTMDQLGHAVRRALGQSES